MGVPIRCMVPCPETSRNGLAAGNTILFAVLTVASLRVSSRKPRQSFSVRTQDPRDLTWFEQDVHLDCDPELGFPNPSHETVLMALIELSQRQDFRDEVWVEKSVLLELLNWHKW